MPQGKKNKVKRVTVCSGEGEKEESKFREGNHGNLFSKDDIGA